MDFEGTRWQFFSVNIDNIEDDVETRGGVM